MSKLASQYKNQRVLLVWKQLLPEISPLLLLSRHKLLLSQVFPLVFWLIDVKAGLSVQEPKASIGLEKTAPQIQHTAPVVMTPVASLPGISLCFLID
jgi:hypothetical protein